MEGSPGSPSRRTETVDTCRKQARRLLKSLRDGNIETALAAAQRFLALRSFAELSPEELCASDRVRLKHALTVIAVEAGFASWIELKTAQESGAGASPPMWEPRMAMLLNRWFADYEEARQSRHAEGGYLLPFRDQFVVTESEGVLELGLDPGDPDWERIGWDWVRPLDPVAHGRLAARRRGLLARIV